jgi:hypothetical protein
MPELRCPRCGGAIRATAIKCEFCGKRLRYATSEKAGFLIIGLLVVFFVLSSVLSTSWRAPKTREPELAIDENRTAPRALMEADRAASAQREQKTSTARSRVGVDLAGSFSLLRVAGASRKEMQQILGPASSWEQIEYSSWGPSYSRSVYTAPKGLYLDGAVEIVFIGGKADWITVYPQGLEYSPDAVAKYLGLTWAPPYVSNRFTIRWEGIQGLLEVAAFPQSESSALVRYLYIQAKTP